MKPEEPINEPEPSTVPDMDPPTGIELHPTPPLATRLRKRPGWIVFGVLLVVTLAVCYSVYERRDRFIRSAFDDHKSVEPATRAGQEITKDIAPGVANLADERNKTSSDLPRSDSHSAQNTPYPVSEPSDMLRPSQSPPGVVTLPPAFPHQAIVPPGPPKLSSADERLAAAYERELQAIAAPTSIQSETGSNPSSFGELCSNTRRWK